MVLCVGHSFADAASTYHRRSTLLVVWPAPTTWTGSPLTSCLRVRSYSALAQRSSIGWPIGIPWNAGSNPADGRHCSS